jgi:hypothetical protein
MRSLRNVWLLWGVGHLITVVCGACYLLPDGNSGPAAQIVRWYATMSGAESSYGFFAPVVGARHRAKFLLVDDNGCKSWETLDQPSSVEAQLRVTGIVENVFMSGDADEFPKWRKRLVKSWAAAMFTRHPSAESLTVVVQFYDLPAIGEYRAGSRPSWKTVYRGVVQRRASPVSERTKQ